MTSLYVDGYGVTGLGAFGIVANIVGIFDLLQKKNRQIFFNLLLSSQLVFDTLLLATFLIRSFFTYFVGIPNEQFFMYYLILCPLRRFSICSSMFMTVTLTFSRANAVEKPLQNRNSIYSQSERIKRLCKHVFPSFVASIILTIPWYWEFEVQYNFKTSSGTPILLPSDLRLDPIYSLTIIAAINLVILAVIPTIAIIGLSHKIYRGIRRRFSAVGRNVADTQTRVFNDRSNINKTAFLIAIFFLVFRIPRIILTIMDIVIQILTLNKSDFAYEMGCYSREWISSLYLANDIFQVLNSLIHVFMFKGVSMFKTRQSLNVSKTTCVTNV